MKKLVLYTLVSMLALAAKAQDFEKPNISVLPFSGWSGPNAAYYQSVMTEKIIARIVDSNKFNVITTDDAELEAIAKEMRLQLSGFVDEDSGVEIGNRRGVSKFIVGNFTGNSVTYHRATYNDEGDLSEQEHYVAQLRASIKMLDIASGQYVQSSEASAYGRARSEAAAIQDALDRLGHEIVGAFKKHFLIQAYVEYVTDPEVYLDRGENMGVRKWMTFEIFDLDTQGKRAEAFEVPAGTPVFGILKITETSKSGAKGLIMGKHQPVKNGMLLREMRDKPKTTATIIDKKLNTITIDRGKNFQIRPGNYFTVLKPVKGRNNYGRIKRVGSIYIDNAQQNISTGKILRGRYRFTSGMEVEQSSGTPFEAGGSFSYGVAFNPQPIRANRPSGEVLVNNGEPGLVTVPTEYLDTYQTLSGEAERYEILGNFKNLLYNYSLSFGMDYYRISGGELNAWVPKFGAGYHFGLLPEVLYLSPGVEIGVGYMSQNFDAVSQISDGEREFARNWSIMLGAKLEASLHVKSVVLFADVSYRRLSFERWSYRARTGDYDDDGNPETKAYQLPQALAPYPTVEISPIFISGGIRLEIPVW